MQTSDAGQQGGAQAPDVWGAVCRPAFVVAVAVLLFNDHVLKSAAVVPGWLSGKLSDFAGLFFFPVLLAVLAAGALRVREIDKVRTYSRRAAVATAGVFAVLNLSPLLAERVTELWGAFTADWTDLVAVPFAFLGHRWFVGTLRESQRQESRPLVRATMVVVAAGASIATSPPDRPPAPASVTNEKDPSLEFVDSSAELFYEHEKKGVYRIQIDGKKRVQIGPPEYRFWSSSLSGETVLLLDGEKSRLYREDASEQEKFPDYSWDVDNRIVSPGGDYVAVGTSTFHSSDDTYSYKLHLVPTDTMESKTIRSRKHVESPYRVVGWEMDGSRLYAQTYGGDWARYSLKREEWTPIATEDFDWSDLHGTHYDGDRCRGEDGVVKLVDPFAEGNAEEFEGLELVGPDGTSEVLVEVEISDEVDDLDDYVSPMGEYFFIGDCNYVIFRLATKPAIRVVRVDSKIVGTIAEGAFSVVPEFHVDAP